jgi:hypothetical protein
MFLRSRGSVGRAFPSELGPYQERPMFAGSQRDSTLARSVKGLTVSIPFSTQFQACTRDALVEEGGKRRAEAQQGRGRGTGATTQRAASDVQTLDGWETGGRQALSGTAIHVEDGRRARVGGKRWSRGAAMGVIEVGGGQHVQHRWLIRRRATLESTNQAMADTQGPCAP